MRWGLREKFPAHRAPSRRRATLRRRVGCAGGDQPAVSTSTSSASSIAVTRIEA
ncbi:hypothetical protein [Lysobacter gummosus]|uniref:hypothetical protein n=1 Tax=Lysobacter gummosus TaxID=262324 RepID=UPI003640E45A